METTKKQRAVQLAGPDKLVFNDSKEIYEPNDYQILARVEAVGLCYSDLKLLKQFDAHARKSEITGGIDKTVLTEIPSYVPGSKPTVPGHEAVVRIEAIGNKVEGIRPGGRYLVQTDYRWLPTAGSNAAFGYNFEGALQEYVLMDQRIITSPEGESMLIPANEDLAASAIALVEPWACVEDAYAVHERQSLKAGGKMLVWADTQFDWSAIANLISQYGKPESITVVSNNDISLPVVGDADQAAGQFEPLAGVDMAVLKPSQARQLPEHGYDDIIYFGSDGGNVSSIFGKAAAHGLINIVQCGGKFGSNVQVQVGRVHYGNIRIIGTAGNDPAEAMKHIPATGEIRQGDKINITGAAGPMGTMHVVRNICAGITGVSVYAGDLDDNRLTVLSKIAWPLAQKNNVGYEPYNPRSTNAEAAEKAKQIATIAFDYSVIMAPVGALVVQAVQNAAPNGIINIFAGIPADVTADIDLDGYISRHLYFIGTSGSTLSDMKNVLDKVHKYQLDTNISVAAVAGLEGAIDGIRAVEHHTIAGKIIVYPTCKAMPLTRLDELKQTQANVYNKLTDGIWNAKAEQALINQR